MPKAPARNPHAFASCIDMRHKLVDKLATCHEDCIKTAAWTLECLRKDHGLLEPQRNERLECIAKSLIKPNKRTERLAVANERAGAAFST